MSFAFKLPSTSSLSFVGCISSVTHPSLTSSATTHRGVIREILKKHKRLPAQSQTPHLPIVLNALEEYIPYLLALDTGLRNSANPGPSLGDKILCTLEQEIVIEWRATLTATVPGKEPSRLKVHGLESEILFTLTTLAYTYSLLSRSALHTLYNTKTPTTAQRTTAITTSMTHLLAAHSIHSYLQTRSTTHPTSGSPPTDITPAMQGALAALTLGAATLITVLKDDPYPAIVTQGRNKADKEWMYKPPDTPLVRAHLFARLCLAAAAHAARASAMLSGAPRADAALARYADDLRRTARAKAFRFFGIDADAAGRTGEGVAWLRAARAELGFGGQETDGKGLRGSGSGGGSGVAARLKRGWGERREDRRIEREGEWGNDAGRYEEGRVVEMLEAKWAREIESVNVQAVPPLAPLLAALPSGREYHDPKPWRPLVLDEATLARMRAPPEPGLEFGDADDESSDDDDAAAAARSGGVGNAVGAFPGTEGDYEGSSRYY